ncbi:MAG: UvrD-helicase domain-containing protein [Bacteroidales bacterium]
MLNIHKASAGSGKTFTLAYEYIKLLLGRKDENGDYKLNTYAKCAHSSILAITFTNKATDEMKHRIIKELAALSQKDNLSSAYLNLLKSEFGATTEQIQQSASNALKSLLNDFNNFNVSTIDSFFHSILRTFAREVDIPYNYDIELQDNYAIKVGINDLLTSLSNSPNRKQLLDWLEKYMFNQIDNDSNWNIFAEKSHDRGTSLFSLARNLSNEEFKRHQTELEVYLEDKDRLSEFQRLLNEYIESSLETINNTAKEFEQYIINRLGVTLDCISRSGGLQGFRKILEKGASVALPAGFAIATEKSDKWFTKSKAKNLILHENDIATISVYIDTVLEAKSIILNYELTRANLYALGLLGDINSHMFKFRNENNLILQSDTNELLSSIIKDDSDTPFIYERVGIMLKHFLIDEFQDTSRLQWANMHPLLSESLSQGNDNLIIGDQKQSIYRFRNADPNLLQNQIEYDFSGYIPSNSSNMSTNWRSARNIIEFNNILFLSLAKELDCTDFYSNVEQLVAPKNRDNHGYVNINFIEETEDKKWKEIVLDELPERINSMLSRGVKQSDIAILVNKHSEGTEVIECLFKYNKDNPTSNLKIISDESLLLKNSPAVRLIIGVLRNQNCSNSSSDTSKEKISTLLKVYEESLSNGHSTSSALSIGISAINSNSSSSIESATTYSSSLISITEDIINKYITGAVRVTENAYIQAFQDTIIDFSARYTPTVHHFIKWWDANGDKITINSPANSDAITVMTIHKSKGLEFPSVIIPFCEWELDSGRGFIWIAPKLLHNIKSEIVPNIVPISYTTKLQNSEYAKEYNEIRKANIIDTLNKSYVAFTRAGQELLVYTPAKPSKGYISEYLNSLIEDKPYINGNLINFSSDNPPTDDNMYLISDYSINLKIPNLRYKLTSTAPAYTPQEHGILLHKIFGLIQYADNLESVINQCQSNGLIKSENSTEIYELIYNAINYSELTASWFARGNRVLMERTVINGSNLRRPDRVVIDSKNNVTIIDYKFGTTHSTKYKKQISEYIDMLKGVGFTNVTGYLWFPNEMVIEQIN